MMSNNILKHILMAPGALTLILIIAGCGERDVAGIDYDREIRSFIRDSLDGQELFSTDIYPQDSPFSLDETTDLYYYRVDNVERTIAIDFSSEPRDIYPHNDVYDAVASITDNFFGRLYRIRDNDTTLAYNFESKLERYAYFLKLYGNAYEYHGWRFWGYSCLNYSIDGVFSIDGNGTFPATRSSSLPNFRLGGYYVVKHDIPVLSFGDSLTFSSGFKERIMAEDHNEIIRGLNAVLDGDIYKIGWRIPPASSEFYHLITIDSDVSGYHFREVEGEGGVIDSILVKVGDYAIPYAIGN